MCELHCTCCNGRARACRRPWLRSCVRGSFCICRTSCRWCRRVLFCSFHVPCNLSSKENNADNLSGLNHSCLLFGVPLDHQLRGCGTQCSQPRATIITIRNPNENSEREVDGRDGKH